MVELMNKVEPLLLKIEELVDNIEMQLSELNGLFEVAKLHIDSVDITNELEKNEIFIRVEEKLENFAR